MKNSQINWMISFGWATILLALAVTLLAWFAGSDDTEERKAAKSGNSRIDFPGRKVADWPDINRTNSPQRPRRDLDLSQDSLAASRLGELHSEGDLSAIHSELSALADAHGLQKVENLLKVWCREGRMELAQICIALSENEPDLNLELSAAALANPSEIIRDLASSRLENASGMTFENSAAATAWLRNRAKP